MIADLDKIIYDFRQRTVSTNFSYADLRKRSFLLLQGWIVGHILKTDAKMIPYIAAARDAGLINDAAAAPSVINKRSPLTTDLLK
jgi:hemerythrin